MQQKSNTTKGAGMLAMDALDYPLPESSIAVRPADPRDSSRLMVVRRSTDVIEHRRVSDLPSILQAGDAMVFNTTSVLAARLIGKREDSGGRVEGLFLESDENGRWLMMLKSNGRLREGCRVCFRHSEQDQASDQHITIELREKQGPNWLVSVDAASNDSDAGRLDAVGFTPLPPYILRARDEAVDDAQDRVWYQTVFSDAAKRGSVAAPTAGLHFTDSLLDQLQAAEVERIDVTLHVGAGTFKPVTASTLEGHDMHSERFAVGAEALESLRAAKLQNRRVIAVGTTSARTIESLAKPLPTESLSGSTDLLIAPGYEFKVLSGLLTNFHLPRSTLLALVGAMLGLERTMTLYQLAIDEGYRFYSYGDAMLILP